MVCLTSGCKKRNNLNPDGYCPDCIKRQKLRKPCVNDVKCLKCDQVFENDTTCGIQCEICEEWVHPVCIDISLEAYDILFKKGVSALSGFKWFCDKCDIKLIQTIDKMATIESKTTILEKDMKVVIERVEKIEKNIKHSVKDEVSEFLEHKDEIDWRKNNLVVFGLPEPVEPSGISTGPWNTEKKIEQDTIKIKEIITTELGVGLSPRNEIYGARRLGTWNPDRPRPLRITFDDIQTKRSVLGSAKKLKQSTDPVLKGMHINPDLTEEQRKADAVLRTEMWRRRTENNENVVIRKGKLVIAEFEVTKIRTKLSDRKTKGDSSGASNSKTNSGSQPNRSDTPVVDNTAAKTC